MESLIPLVTYNEHWNTKTMEIIFPYPYKDWFVSVDRGKRTRVESITTFYCSSRSGRANISIQAHILCHIKHNFFHTTSRPLTYLIIT